MRKNAFFSHLKSADFETFCDWSTSSWRNNLDTPWCNSLVCNNLDDVITLWSDVKNVTPHGHVLFTALGKLMFEYIFWYEVNQWFLNDIAQKFWKIMGFQNMINSHDVQLVNYTTYTVHSYNTYLKHTYEKTLLEFEQWESISSDPRAQNVEIPDFDLWPDLDLTRDLNLKFVYSCRQTAWDPSFCDYFLTPERKRAEFLEHAF